ncbi:hypothetical protein D3C87_1807060 [compost metagenome]
MVADLCVPKIADFFVSQRLAAFHRLPDPTDELVDAFHENWSFGLSCEHAAAPEPVGKYKIYDW